MGELPGEPARALRPIDVVEHVGRRYALARGLCLSLDELHPVLPPGRVGVRLIVHAVEHVPVTQRDREQLADELVLKASHQVVLLLSGSRRLLVFRMPGHAVEEGMPGE